MQRSDSLSEMQRIRRGRRARRLCLASVSTAGLLYVASPFVTLWSLASAVRNNDQVALQSGCDWKLVRDGLKHSLGLPGMQRASAGDDLPGFGDSFAAGVASGMIDQDVSPAHLGEMLRDPALGRGGGGLPRGAFVSPSRFEATIPVSGAQPIVISMAVEQWRWKVVRVSIPDELFQASSPDNGHATRRS